MREIQKDVTTNPYDCWAISPLISKVLQSDSANYTKYRNDTFNNVSAVVTSVWGKKMEKPILFSPSTSSYCIRWNGFQILGKVPPAPTEEKASTVLMMGTGAHNSLSYKLKGFGQSEQILLDEEHSISGRFDFMFKNLTTQRWQIVDFKFVSPNTYKMINREGLPTYLRGSRFYNPTPEARLQVITYMAVARYQNRDVAMGNVVYFNRLDGDRKETIVPWDPIAKYDADEFFKKLDTAKKQIEKDVLPEPSVQSSHVCAYFCPYRAHCDYGEKFAAHQVKKENKRRPAFVYRQLKAHIKEEKQRMEKLGVIQPLLPGFAVDEK